MNETTPPDELTAETLDELERLERVATRGPWFIEGAHMDYAIRGNQTGSQDGWAIADNVFELEARGTDADVKRRARDAALVLALRNAAPALIASARLAAERGERIRELEAELAELRRPPSLLRPAVVIPPLDLKDPETAANLARGADTARALREPCTRHNLDADGICIKCDRRIATRVP
jgi:hypothetical protein